jgi:hypothetical protein
MDARIKSGHDEFFQTMTPTHGCFRILSLYDIYHTK